MLAFRLDTAAMVQGIREWMLPLEGRQVTQNGIPRDKCKISQLEKPGPLPTTARESMAFPPSNLYPQKINHRQSPE